MPSSHLVLPAIFQRAIAERPGVDRSTLNVADPPFTLATDIGYRRQENQDRVGALRFVGGGAGEPTFFCGVVSDGMGGMVAGADCAEIAISHFFSALLSNLRVPSSDRLMRAMLAANSAVHAKYGGKGGATLSAALVEASGKTWVVNVGDSRVYASHLSEPKLIKVTTDDTLADAFGGVARDLVQFVGIGQPLAPRVDPLGDFADLIFLTSDGAHYVPPELLEQVVHHAGDPKRSVDRVMALARWLGGPDNASIIGFRLADIVKGLRHPHADGITTTVWSPQSETIVAQLPESVQDFSRSPAQPQAADEKHVSKHPDKRSGKKRNRERKQHEKEAQLEIKIESDGDGNASDS